MGLWAQMGDSEQAWDEMLDNAHQVGQRTKLETEEERTRLSPKTRAVVKRRLSISQGLTEDDALAGFLAEIEQVFSTKRWNTVQPSFVLISTLRRS